RGPIEVYPCYDRRVDPIIFRNSRPTLGASIVPYRFYLEHHKIAVGHQIKVATDTTQYSRGRAIGLLLCISDSYKVVHTRIKGKLIADIVPYAGRTHGISKLIEVWQGHTLRTILIGCIPVDDKR